MLIHWSSPLEQSNDEIRCRKMSRNGDYYFSYVYFYFRNVPIPIRRYSHLPVKILYHMGIQDYTAIMRVELAGIKRHTFRLDRERSTNYTYPPRYFQTTSITSNFSIWGIQMAIGISKCITSIATHDNCNPGHCR